MPVFQSLLLHYAQWLLFHTPLRTNHQSGLSSHSGHDVPAAMQQFLHHNYCLGFKKKTHPEAAGDGCSVKAEQ